MKSISDRLAVAIALIGVAFGGAYFASAAAPSEGLRSAGNDLLNIHRLPLGDGDISATPKRGYVMSCRSGPGRRGGARHSGPWIHGNTWSLVEKPHVRGRVMWPQATFSVRVVGTGATMTRLIQGNGLPVETPTGTFPISPLDPAYRYDTNPNYISAYRLALSLPLNPQIAAKPSCVPMGIVGVALNGVAIFNALDDGGRDAEAHEVQDLCGGHPQSGGIYHYHGPSPCLPNETKDDRLVGYAIDGFGIYSMYNSAGKEITNADLDACHGRVSSVDWNGKRVAIYHYVLTREYPYTIGCFRGTPTTVPRIGSRRRRRSPRRRR